MSVRFAPVLLAALVGAGCLSDPGPSPPDRAALRAEWVAWRAERDSLFASPGSPLPPPSRADFDGLPYYPYDSLRAVTAAFVPRTTQDTVRFPTTTAELRPFVAAGHLTFVMDGAPRQLAVFQSVGAAPRLFLPFRDATSGQATYGAGRYIDLDLEPSGRYALDFNRSYNPYCAYDPAYSCPLPPAENTMTLSLGAGELHREK